MRTGVKIAVTGGSGFLGTHLLPLLAENGADVTSLLRKGSSLAPHVKSIKILRGNCLTGEGLDKLVSDCDILIHMAFLLFGLGWQNYLQTNIRACQNFVAAITALAPEKQPQKIIFVSSLAASGPCGKAPGRDESEPASPVSAYGWSKLLCENMLSSAFQDRCVILRPAIIYGSGDKGLLPMFRAASRGIGISPGFRRKFPVSAIHARDASRAIMLACKDTAHGIYHLDDGVPYDMDILCNAMAQATGKKKCRMLHMPLPVMAASASACETAASLARQILPKNISGSFTPKWNLDKYREARQTGWLSNSERIRRELGFKAELTLAEGMAEAVKGYHARGML